jgi:hypothetical protein
MSNPTTKTIEITVSPAGDVSIKTAGFTSSSCKDATRDIERALGVARTEHLLPEFYNRTNTGEQLRQGN